MKYISPTKVHSNREHYFIIDIREAYEYEAHNMGCKHIPMAEMEKHVETYRNHEHVVIMCKSGKRAEALTNLLQQEYNLENLYILEGGYDNWLEAIKPDLKLD